MRKLRALRATNSREFACIRVDGDAEKRTDRDR